ncbi:MAG: HD domain-containing phosphohydrolase [Actinomycetota bacterium]|nr:HD domain-containing phosphohydrolase [Actinomycetota bacterium]
MEKLEHVQLSDAGLALLFEFSRGPSFAYDPSSLRIAMVNDTALNYYGYSREDFLNLTLDEIIDPAFLPTVLQSFAEQCLFKMDMIHTSARGRRLEVQMIDRELLIAGMAIRVVQVQALDEIELQQRILTRQLDAVLNMVSTMIRMRDPFTDRHQFRVAALTTAMVHEMGLARNEATGVVVAATLHDIGKQGVPVEILYFAGRLNRAAMELVKGHSQAGYDLLEPIEMRWPIAQMTLEHHERLDGSGYPRGLRSKDTLLGSRIIAVADTAESMMSHRPYRAALGIEPTLAELNAGKGVLYEEAAVSACLKVISESDFHFPDGVL